MPSPSSSTATLRPEIAGTFEEFDFEMNRAGFIGARCLPIFDAAESAGNFGRLTLEQLLQTRDTTRSPRSGYARQDHQFTPDTYTTQEHGAEEVVDENEARAYRNYFDAEVVAAQRARDVVLRNQEIRVAGLLFNATTFTSQKTTISNEWDDLANATPIVDVETAVRAVYNRCGVKPNALIIGWNVFRNLRNCAEIVDRIKYSGHDDPKARKITEAVLAEVFDLEHVLVGDAAKNTANQGQAASISPIWSDEYAMVTRIAASQDFAEPCIGRTFHWSEDGSMPLGTVESYREESVRGDVIRVRHQVGEKLIYTAVAQLLDNVTT